MIPLDAVGPDTFAPLQGHGFTVVTGAGNIELLLHAVEKLGNRRPGAQRDPFALVFRGDQGLLLPQGIYRFVCGPLGEMDLFITQIAGGACDSQFEAVFT